MPYDFRSARGRLITIALCCLVYFLASVPFIDNLRLSETTEVRPYCVLPFLLSLVLGFPGTLGSALGNILSDLYYGGMDGVVIALGFCFQLVYGYGGALIWRFLRRRDRNIFRLDKVVKIIQYLLLTALMALVVALLVSATLHLYYSSQFLGPVFSNTLLNNMIFLAVLGIPFFAFRSYHIQKKRISERPDEGGYLLSSSERYILYFVLNSVIVSLVCSVLVYIDFSSSDHQFDQITVWSCVYQSCALILYLSLLPTLMVLRSVEKNIAEPIEKLSAVGRNFGGHENMESEISCIENTAAIYTSDKSEIGQLAGSFRQLSSKLGEYIRKLTDVSREQARVATELNIATDIQNGALPEPEETDGIDLHAFMKTALEVGGDFYDHFRIGDRHLGFVIADVSGKGIPASLFMMISKILIQKNMMDGLSPKDALMRSNNELIRNNRAEMFVTVLCGILDLETGVLRYSSAGHDHPAVSFKSSDFRLLKTRPEFVLGAIENTKYTEHEVTLEKGDVFFVYTDGVPEATNEKDEQYGLDMMLRVLSQNRQKNMKELCAAMMKDLDRHRGQASQFDDITMVAIRRN
ncbi:MAG: serine/threonine-protein phosphatase [Succinivibrionaceae bacterium]|nr:serine/threonine-protein phosphatase [Succinivibrionaceae bacterium]